MERKIGEIFEYNGEWYQCIEQLEKYDKTVCDLCDFHGIGNCELDRCSGTYRSDKKSVIFKKLLKVGDPYMLEDKKFQKYKVFKTPYIYHKIDCSWQSFSDPYYISLEIKEDMEEKKSNLKPFNLQKAREGKPVYTRDGRKARIICFDFRISDGICMIAAIECSKTETIFYYDLDGKCRGKGNNKYDLMMLPEKKEGWINIYKGGKLDVDYIYPTKETAITNIFTSMESNYIDTIKVEWEE